MTELNKAKRIPNTTFAVAVAAMLVAPAVSPRLAHADSTASSNAVAVDKAKDDQPPPPPDDPAASSLINTQLVPGEGYFFRAYVDCELLLPNS